MRKNAKKSEKFFRIFHFFIRRILTKNKKKVIMVAVEKNKGAKCTFGG